MEAARYIEGHGGELPVIEAENLEDRRYHWERTRSEGESIINRADAALEKIPIPGQLVMPLEVESRVPASVTSIGRAGLSTTVKI